MRLEASHVLTLRVLRTEEVKLLPVEVGGVGAREGGWQEGLIHVVAVVGVVVVGGQPGLVGGIVRGVRGVPALPVLPPALQRLLLHTGWGRTALLQLPAAAAPRTAHCRRQAAAELGTILGFGLRTRFFVRN